MAVKISNRQSINCNNYLSPNDDSVLAFDVIENLGKDILVIISKALSCQYPGGNWSKY
jgi:hypothetical protein